MAYYAPVILLQAGNEQLRALVPLTHRLYYAGFNVGNIFFGLHCVSIGYLISRSNFLPRFLAGLMASGVAYMANSLARFLAPTAANILSPCFLLTGFFFELLLTLWLLFAAIKCGAVERTSECRQYATAAIGVSCAEADMSSGCGGRSYILQRI